MHRRWTTTRVQESHVCPSFRCPTRKFAGGMTLSQISHSYSSSDSCDSSCTSFLSFTFVTTSLPSTFFDINWCTFSLHWGQEFSWVSTHCLIHPEQYLWMQESSRTSFSKGMSFKQIAHVSSFCLLPILSRDSLFVSTVLRRRRFGLGVDFCECSSPRAEGSCGWKGSISKFRLESNSSSSKVLRSGSLSDYSLMTLYESTIRRLLFALLLVYRRCVLWLLPLLAAWF